MESMEEKDEFLVETEKLEKTLWVRNESGSKFQIVGVENEKDRRPMALLMLGTSSEFVLDDLRVLVGLYGYRRSKR